jgi:hypothetical protein
MDALVGFGMGFVLFGAASLWARWHRRNGLAWSLLGIALLCDVGLMFS